MWTNSLVKILRPIADYGRHRNPLSRRVAEMSIMQNPLEPTSTVGEFALRYGETTIKPFVGGFPFVGVAARLR
jgi:hypothetical protein